MTLVGPVLGRELLTAARRGDLHRRRSLWPLSLLLAASLPLGIATFLDRGGRLSTWEMALLWDQAFRLAALFQALGTMWLVPGCVAAVIAQERERRTLSGLL